MHPTEGTGKEDLIRNAHGRRQSRRGGTVDGGHRQFVNCTSTVQVKASSRPIFERFFRGIKKNVQEYTSITLVRFLIWSVKRFSLRNK